MSASRSSVLGVIFDFDDTLARDSTSMLLEDRSIDLEEFWRKEVQALVEDGYDSSLAWLNLFLDKVGPRRPLRELSNADLRDFGARLDGEFAPGIPRLFKDLRGIVDEYRDISIEFYIISGGLEDLIRGSRIVTDHFTDVYGCLLDEDPRSGRVSKIKRAVNFTEKTRYLFEINKGLRSEETRRQPLLVNKDVPALDRRIPFENMIYCGDGLTDIPSFSLVKRMGGLAFGVFDPKSPRSAEKAFKELLQPGRVISTHAPKYRESDELGILLRAAVGNRCSQIVLARQQA
jgi:phosphoserine phosphatase